jgi:hypothetical protein
MNEIEIFLWFVMFPIVLLPLLGMKYLKSVCVKKKVNQ